MIKIHTKQSIVPAAGLWAEESMDKLWGESKPKTAAEDTRRGPHFRMGHYPDQFDAKAIVQYGD